MHALYKLLRFLKPHWHFALIAPLLMVGEVLLDLMQPRLIQQIIDAGIAHSDIAAVIRIGFWMMGFMLLAGLFGVAILPCGLRTGLAAICGERCSARCRHCHLPIWTSLKPEQ
jgi:ATP-binding cassette subfamily B protein